MKSRAVVVATHGHCFDGMASAALFTHLMRQLHAGEELVFRYRSCGYGPAMGAMPEGWLDGDDNAILDFRYTPTKRLTWYFDHHITAFASPEEEATALSAETATRVFYDAKYGSCTKLIADVAAREFGVACEGLSGLVAWADTIDAARFASADAAVKRDAPEMQLASVVEHHGDSPFLESIVPRLLERPLSEIASSSDVQDKWRPLAAAHAAFVERVRQSTKLLGAVAFADLTAAPLEAAGKFVTYALYPSCVYSVMLSRGKQQLKVSVGYNPWCGSPRRHDIAAICQRHGGGGHPAVGAFSFPAGQLQKAREAADAIVRELND
jgi:hypothetical protein